MSRNRCFNRYSIYYIPRPPLPRPLPLSKPRSLLSIRFLSFSSFSRSRSRSRPRPVIRYTCMSLHITGLVVTEYISNYNRANDVAGWLATDSYNRWCHRHQNRRLCSRRHYHESMIFFVYLAFILLRYGHFVEYMNMHAMNWCSRQWLWGRIRLCTHGVTTQVMLGVSLRARWDTTLVQLMVH